jgi:dethiobiotin synthetase
MREPARGLFITGTDTDVGKTYVGAMIARSLLAAGHAVGVYKPLASGCRREAAGLVSDDALALWQAAGRPGDFMQVCPQRLWAPLAPHLAAQAEGRAVDADLLRSGLDYWLERSEIVLVEGAGGLMSPLTDEEFVADLAYDFGFPLVVVARDALGAINQTLQTLIVAATFGQGLAVAGYVLNQTRRGPHDWHSAEELARRAVPPLLGIAGYQADRFDRPVDWYDLAGPVKKD